MDGSPYINRFLQPDTLIPDPSNPQSWNRYSYVLGNPIRYDDPTGHMCSDPDDPSPSCDGSGSYPVNQTPLPSAPVVITNPDPLDEGQKQDDPTPAHLPNTSNEISNGVTGTTTQTYNGPVFGWASDNPSTTLTFTPFISDGFIINLPVQISGLTLFAKKGGPKPPGWNPRWKKDGNSWVDPKTGNRWRFHPEDDSHYEHWDVNIPGKGKVRVPTGPNGVFK